MHLYLGAARVEVGTEVTDYRFFVRAIIRHSDLVTKVRQPLISERWHPLLLRCSCQLLHSSDNSTLHILKEASFEYLHNEAERLLLEAMDELEVAFNNTSVRTDCNHIFLNFVPTVIMDPSKVCEATKLLHFQFTSGFINFPIFQNFLMYLFLNVL